MALVKKGTYATGELYIKRIKDEDGKYLYEFMDKLGRKILQRKISNGANVDTYIVYDDLDNPRYVLPPLASYYLTSNGNYTLSSNNYLRLYAYYYRYDQYNRCIEKKYPGIEPVYMMYDCTDKLVCVQNGNQRLNGLWTVNKYDVSGRLVYTSEVKNPAAFDDQRESFATYWVCESFSTKGHTYPMEDTGYSRNYYHIAPTRLLEVYYYDTYAFVDSLTLSSSIKNNLKYKAKTGYGVKSNKTRTLLTGKRIYELSDPTKYTLNVYYYDERGNVIQLRSTNAMGGYEVLYNLCDFLGNITKSFREYTAVSGTVSGKEQYEYDFDHAGRPTTTTYQIDDYPKYVLSEICYDSIGRLSTKKFHDNRHRVHYEYNIRNWLTKIQSAGRTNGFEQNIYYNTNQLNQNVCYNGNVSAVTWRYNTTINGYTYTYDGLNRLSSAVNTRGVNMNETAPDYREKFSYDNHGNVIYLDRYAGQYGMVDQLTYNYSGNQLRTIIDERSNRNLYNLKEYQGKGYSPSATFFYDANGNLIKDSDRNIALIKYNLLNLPDTVQFKNGNQIINRYAANGQKLRSDYITRTTPLASPSTSIEQWVYGVDPITQYADIFCGNRIYRLTKTSTGDKINPPRVNNAEGFTTVMVSSVSGQLTYTPHYYAKDYLGNIRETVMATGITRQRLQYYPSGLSWVESMSMYNQPFKFGDKEFVETHGYDRYDLIGRMYDVSRAGFDQADPMMEKHYDISPYAHCGNDPVNRFDPDGFDWVWRQRKKRTEIYYDRDVRSQADVDNKYGKDSGVTHIKDGTKVVGVNNKGEKVDLFRLHNDKVDNMYGAVTDMQGNLMDNSSIIYGEKFTIFGTSDDSVNAETLHKNLMGTSYTGPFNPKTYGNEKLKIKSKDSYQYIPRNISEIFSMSHDMEYDLKGAAGPYDAILNTSVMEADAKLTQLNIINMINPNTPIVDKARSGGTAFVFGVIAGVKSLSKYNLPMPYWY